MIFNLKNGKLYSLDYQNLYCLAISPYYLLSLLAIKFVHIALDLFNLIINIYYCY